VVQGVTFIFVANIIVSKYLLQFDVVREQVTCKKKILVFKLFHATHDISWLKALAFLVWISLMFETISESNISYHLSAVKKTTIPDFQQSDLNDIMEMQ
jgi:F0F1-type ATP synthase membrane subunit a